MNAHVSMRDACAFSRGVQNVSMSSIGGCSLPRAPRSMFVNACCGDVNSLRASASVSATITFAPTMTYGRASCADGRKFARYSSTARYNSSGAKCEANAYGNPSAAASCAPYRLEPRIHSGTFVPGTGTRNTSRAIGNQSRFTPAEPSSR